ncbi:hypothetical protein SAMN05877838_0896 [Hoeflea halophila]|uniref:Transposase n=1 Tax=Hoeflea halophila TaxID=714899 RepID=A0A286HZ51_9HYPH|nr:hypothetical protein SAMN05877838_0896 [Hoeflea halophila]
MSKRKQHAPELKAKVALEALNGKELLPSGRAGSGAQVISAVAAISRNRIRSQHR